jgi:hypothetical protein
MEDILKKTLENMGDNLKKMEMEKIKMEDDLKKNIMEDNLKHH